MNSISRFALLSSVALAALPVYAAEVAAKPDSASAAVTEAPNDIIVTARRTKETLQDTPIAVSVVTGEFLNRTGFTQVAEIARFVPGLALSAQYIARHGLQNPRHFDIQF